MPSDDEDDAPKKPEKPKTKRVDKPEDGAKPKKPSGSAPALKRDGKSEPDGADKPRTKRLSKDAAPKDAPEEGSAEAPKSKTGKRPRPSGGGDEAGAAPAPKKKRPGGERPKAPAPEPAKRGGVEYALAVLGPLLGAAGGAYAFLLISQGMDRAANPILGYLNPADVPQSLGISFATMFPPAGILVGLVLGLIVTFEALKMAPGTATRVMGVLTLLLTLCGVAPFVLAGNKLNEHLAGDIAKHYKVPRGGSPDPRALELKIKPDEFALRQLRATFKVDLDDGDIPPAWVAAAKDWAGDPKADEKLENENEKKIKCGDLRTALQACRDLMGKYKAEIEPMQAKLVKLCDAAATAETQTLEDGWAKFEGRLRRDLAKPPKPKGAGAWFTACDTWADIGEQEPTKKDLPINQKLYLGKAIHAAMKDLPPEMRFVGAIRTSIAPEYVAANENEKLVTKFSVAWVCYDLEKLDRDPVIIPHLNGFLDDQRFKIEVLGEK